MRVGARDWRGFANRNTGVTFVTFNFDSVIEQQLAHSIGSAYRDAPKEQIQKIVENMIGVHHLHGRLPEPPMTRMVMHSPKRQVAPEWVDWLEGAAASL